MPSAYAVRVLGIVDIARDGREQVMLSVGGETWTLGAIVVLDAHRLVTISDTPDGHPLGWGAHTNADPRGTADVWCGIVDGAPSLVVANSTVTLVGGAQPAPENRMNIPDAQLERHWERWVYRLDGARLERVSHDTGAFRLDARPPAGVPLANRLACGSARE
jgi:hypothetical protein